MEIQCKLCNSTVLKTSKVVHAISHSDLIIFECGYCPKKFTHNNTSMLRKHILNQHKKPGEPINYDNYKDNRKELKEQINEWKERCFPTE
ncbi:hypothetical protein CAEBREN_10645 [Caenorhabditis brenneri]|uniref:C2H2-type domain-containing protein n=1 Tax=Caenorhabditis brenneri TaxID=135651 RepID=G0NGN6_CAEBE|nr:hypothetical protein CAEBREN_10645 [Caenorhabditis brenneri]